MSTEYDFKLTWEEIQMIIDMFDDHDSEIAEKLSIQLLQHAEPVSCKWCEMDTKHPLSCGSEG